MKLIIGLGNPDKEYLNNRHNVGHLLVDRLLTTDYSPEMRVEKTDVYMNESGEFVARQKNFYKVSLDDLYVVYDDLDIPLGSYKISKGKSPRVHNGIISVIEKLGSEDFWHVRIGVDNRSGDRTLTGKDYVLQNFTKEERGVLEEVIEKVVEELNHG